MSSSSLDSGRRRVEEEASSSNNDVPVSRASPQQSPSSPHIPLPAAAAAATTTTTGMENAPSQRKLRVMVITIGGERQEQIRAMFRSLALSNDDFEEPVFSPGMPSRSLRNRMQFFRICHQVGLIPEQEWQAMEKAHAAAAQEDDPKDFFDCLKDVPIETSEPDGRRRRRIGNEADRKLHYSVELWRKAKTINRGRSVLACTLAHLLALQKFTSAADDDDGDAFDVLLEDNVRVPIDQAFCADRVRQVIQASRDYAQQTHTPCHLRYYGWLGSMSNLRWIHESYLPKKTFLLSPDSSETTTTTTTTTTARASVAPFPTAQDIENDLLEKQQVGGELDRATNLMQTQSLDDKGDCIHDDNQQQTNGQQQQQERPPGGTPVWGAYAYWISRQAYEHVLHELQQDVGSLLWKGKRARYYSVKPIDKILPRKVKELSFGTTTDAIHISTRPCFFRAPMLTSRIHAQWDASFCESTQYQLAHYCDNLKWSDLWLTRSERAIVDHYQEHGKWLTLSELEEKQATATNEDTQ